MRVYFLSPRHTCSHCFLLFFIISTTILRPAQPSVDNLRSYKRSARKQDELLSGDYTGGVFEAGDDVLEAEDDPSCEEAEALCECGQNEIHSLHQSATKKRHGTNNGANLVDQHMINNMVGLIIEQLTARFPESVQLGDISSSHFFGKARFEAALGSMKSVHSLERSGDVIFEWGNREVSVTLTVTFTKLEVTYEEYSVSVVGMTTSGRLKTTAFNNLFRIVAVINDYSECFVTLKRFDVLELGNFQINLYPKSGNLLVGWLSSSTVTSAVNFFKERIRSTVEKEVRQVLLNQITPSKFVCIKFPRAK